MLKQSFQQKLLQKLSPQQIQLMKLLQVPTVELEQRIKEELEVNPALEEGREETEDEFEEQEDFEEKESTESQEDFDISDYLDDDTPDYKLSASNRSADDEDKQVPIGSGRTFSEILTTQLGLRNLTEKQEELADYLIGNLDDSGYLRRELGAIVNDMAFSQNLIATEEELEAVLKIIQQFDPPGVGGRNLRECLLIQMKRKNNHSPAQELAVTLLQNFFEEFTKKHYSKISKKLDLEDSDLKGAIDEILKLNPKPGNSLMESSKTVPYVVPDFLVLVEEDELKLSLNQRNAPELKVSRQYRNMLETYAASKGDKKQKEAIMFVKQKIDSAKWFIDAIRQRQNTLLITMHAILEYQKEYFLSGDETKIKPMILKDIAEIVEMDISTISRVANSKYVQTPYGTFLLKTFFSESLSTDSGEEVYT